MNEHTKQKVAIYCRLSEEDREKTGAESESIQNQKAMLLRYAEEQKWQVYNLYSDEDYTGADRSRPAFNQLLQDAANRRFDIVLCKSQSRFTRELELVERYLHDRFPQWGIRFVGYADHADTANRGNKKARQINGLVNEWYLEDLSDNIRTVFRTKQAQGKFIGSFAPYGYEKSMEDKNRLVMDPQAAVVVRSIFEKSAAGMSPGAIAAELNRRSLPNPSAYKAKKYSSFCRAGQKTSKWSGSTVRTLLTNPIYCGDMRQHVREKISYKADKVRCVPQEEQILVKDCQPALVSRDLWLQAQPRVGEKTARSSGRDPLQTATRCGICDRILQVRYSHGRRYFTCRAHHVLIQAAEVQNFLDQLQHNAGEEEQKGEKEKVALLDKMRQACADAAAGTLSATEFAAFQTRWQEEWKALQQKNTDAVQILPELRVFPRERRNMAPVIQLISDMAADN